VALGTELVLVNVEVVRVAVPRELVEERDTEDPEERPDEVLDDLLVVVMLEELETEELGETT
jgi:hypothetical protein